MRSVFTFIWIFLVTSCSSIKNITTKISGAAQGTTYHITYLSPEGISFKKELDSLLSDLDSSLSTYVPISVIARINKNDSSVLADGYFIDVFNKAMEVSEKTGGSFDVTVAPIINAYGFGFTSRANVDSAMIDSLLGFIGYKMVKLKGNKLVKSRPEVMLDFNAIAQGYSVDVLASFLESKGIEHYLVELGGEVKSKGKNEKNEYWRVGIEQPKETADEVRPLEAIVGLRNAALATSGNYRKFYVENGKKYSHIIDPHTGYPARHNLLSTTVIAKDCMTADAYATAFMVMGLANSIRFLDSHKDLRLQVFFIYDEDGNWKSYTSEGLKHQIREIH
jgi:thiamine biosynthesis lipoprotein